GDFDGDGLPDVVSTAGDSLVMLPGRGDGTLGSPVAVSAGDNPVRLAVGDLNHDGHPDLVVLNSAAVGTTPGGVSILLNDGRGPFRRAYSYAVGLVPQAVLLGDFDGDGRLDLVVASAGIVTTTTSKAGSVSVFLGNGDGSFRDPAILTVGLHPQALA